MHHFAFGRSEINYATSWTVVIVQRQELHNFQLQSLRY
uniref:Uncharacterized protein n=1 Tax=Arundo donax TaxID=35708 RepID=A0A0A8XQ81_ARUDO